MNILYIGHYRERSSLGSVSRKYIDGLIASSNINISIKPIFLQNERLVKELPTKYVELENESYQYYDAVIQDTFPDFYQYDQRFGKNICIPKVETRLLHHTGWIEKINMMDETWASSFFVEKSLRESGVDTKIKVVPTPFDLEYVSKHINKKQDTEYNFYTISSTLLRDNLLSLLIAYFTEFRVFDNARLIIKVDDNESKIKNIITQAYNLSRIDPNMINEPIIINGYIDEEKMIDLHNNSNCYIDISKASCAGVCCIEAALYKNLVICTNHIGPASYISNNNGFNIDSTEVDVISEAIFGLPNAYTIYEKWYEPKISSIKEKMRLAYETNSTELENKLSKFNNSIFNKNAFYRNLL